MIGTYFGYLINSNDDCNTISEINTPIPTGAGCEFQRLDSNTIFYSVLYGNYSLIYKSTNEGNTWTQKLYTDTVLGVELIMFDSLEGVLLCYQYTSLHTYDGGNTWLRLPTQMLAPDHYAKDGDSTVCIGTENGVGISKDRGHTWVFNGINAFGPIQHTRISYLNKDTILDIGHVNPDGSYFAYSVDAGVNCTKFSFPSPFYFDPYGLFFFTMDEGYLVGTNNFNNDNGTIYKTIDRGLTWSIYDTHIPSNFGCIHFLNDSIALIGGSKGTLLKWNKNAWPTSVINTEQEINTVNLYPNPANDFVHLYYNNTATSNIEIYLQDAIGNIIGITKENAHIGNNDYYFNISKLSSGIYFYTIFNGVKSKSIKLIKY